MAIIMILLRQKSAIFPVSKSVIFIAISLLQTKWHSFKQYHSTTVRNKKSRKRLIDTTTCWHTKSLATMFYFTATVTIIDLQVTHTLTNKKRDKKEIKEKCIMADCRRLYNVVCAPLSNPIFLLLALWCRRLTTDWSAHWWSPAGSNLSAL